MTWNPRTYEEGLRMAWDEDDDGIDHCLSYIEPRIPKGAMVVDIGCGVGRLTVPLAWKRPDCLVFGMDTSMSMLALASGRSRGVSWQSQLPPGFDVAFSVVTFQHIGDDEMRRYLREVAKRKAIFVFQFVEGNEREPLSMQRSLRDVTDWCIQAGFTDVEGERDSRFPNWWWMTCRMVG